MEKKDWVRRIKRLPGGDIVECRIERRQCKEESCRKIHRLLPDEWIPCKHYEASLIEDVIDGNVCEDDLETENYPCAATMKRWIDWWQRNKSNAEGYLRSAAHEVLGLSDSFLKASILLLEKLREKLIHGWLSATVRVMCNSGGKPVPSG